MLNQFVPEQQSSEPPAVNYVPDSSEREIEPDVLQSKKEQVDPTRYGDWEKNGRCIDF